MIQFSGFDGFWSRQTKIGIIHLQFYGRSHLQGLKVRLKSYYLSKCHLLNVGTTSDFYNYFGVPNFKELAKLDTFTSDFGFMHLWQKTFRIWFQQKISNDAELKSQFVNFSHLVRFFILCVIQGGMCAGTFLTENVTKQNRRRELYAWSKSILTLVCLHYFKVALIINQLLVKMTKCHFHTEIL